MSMEAMDEFTHGPMVLDEYIKLMSLFENPPEAAAVRKALRFYEVPQGLQFNWGANAGSAGVMKHYACPQNLDELAFLLKHVEGKRSLLEVGSSFGGTLKRMASVMPKGSRIVSVDLPIDTTPQCLNPLASLKEVCRQLSFLGANVNLFVGDSHSASVIEAVREHAPFEFGFIDGDHSYDGVKADWENYGPMCKVVGFHDVAGPLACEQFWKELKAEGKYRTEEFAASDAHRYGIGIVYRE